jgi:hypothetical protein
VRRGRQASHQGHHGPLVPLRPWRLGGGCRSDFGHAGGERGLHGRCAGVSFWMRGGLAAGLHMRDTGCRRSRPMEAHPNGSRSRFRNAAVARPAPFVVNGISAATACPPAPGSRT